MVSKAREDFPERDSPVKTIRRSRGRSRETSRKLCSRAPRTTRRSAISRGYREGGTPAIRSTRDRRAEPRDLVPEEGRLLETQLGSGGFHFRFELGHQLDGLRRRGGVPVRQQGPL